MNTNVLLSSIFFIAASVVNGNLIILNASILKNYNNKFAQIKWVITLQYYIHIHTLYICTYILWIRKLQRLQNVVQAIIYTTYRSTQLKISIYS
jgi:hypothetical protein